MKVGGLIPSFALGLSPQSAFEEKSKALGRSMAQKFTWGNNDS